MRAAASPLHCVTSTCRPGDMAERRGQSVCQLLRHVIGPEVHEEQTRLVVEHVIVQRRHPAAVLAQRVPHWIDLRDRSEARRVGREWDSTCISEWRQYHSKKK